MNKTDPQMDRSYRLMQSFWDLQKNLMRYAQITAANHGLSVTQYNILMMLSQHQQIPQKEIQEKTFLPKSTLSQAINRLVELGYVVRQQVEGNRREIDIAISTQGTQLVKEMSEQEDGFHRLCQNAVEALSDEQFESFITIQQKLSTNFSQRGSDDVCSES